MIESNYLHRRRFQNCFCVSVIGRKGGVCPGKDKGAVSAWTPVGNRVTVSNKLSKQELRLGNTWVTNFLGSQSHPETHSTLKYSFIRHSMNNVWKNRIGWPLIEMQLSRGRKREGKYCRCAGMCCWQCDKACEKDLDSGFSWNLEVAPLFLWKLSWGLTFSFSLSPLALNSMLFLQAFCSTWIGGKAWRAVFWILEAD